MSVQPSEKIGKPICGIRHHGLTYQNAQPGLISLPKSQPLFRRTSGCLNLDIDEPILEELQSLQERGKKSLGQLASSLLAEALRQKRL